MALPVGADELGRLIAEGAYRPALEARVQNDQHLIIHHRIAMLGAAAYGEEVAQEGFLGTDTAMPRFQPWHTGPLRPILVDITFSTPRHPPHVSSCVGSCRA